VVGHVGDRSPSDLHPIAVVGAHVGYGPHPDLRPVDLDVRVEDVVERDVPVQLLDGEREERRAHELAECLLKRARLLRRAVHVEPGPRRQDGSEEREPLDVVPMQVGDERRALERSVGGQRLTQLS
jgi:hypothetical protein